MPPFALIKFNPLSLKSVQLGRLVLSTTSPGQDFIDPLDGRPTDDEFTTTSQKNFECSRKFSKKSGLRSYLNTIVPFSRETETEHVLEITVPEVTTLELMNSGSWFKDASGQKATREWLKGTFRDRAKVYLVVGYRTLGDAKFVFSSTSKVATGTKAEVPTPGVGAMADLGASGNRETIRHENDSFDSPDEQIFEVQYRRVKFKQLSSRKISSASLEANRWETRRLAYLVRYREDTLEVELTDSSDSDTTEEEEEEVRVRRRMKMERMERGLHPHYPKAGEIFTEPGIIPGTRDGLEQKNSHGIIVLSGGEKVPNAEKGQFEPLL